MAIGGEVNFIIAGQDQVSQVVAKVEKELTQLSKQAAAINKDLAAIKPPTNLASGINVVTQRLEAFKKELDAVKAANKQAFNEVPAEALNKAILLIGGNTRKVGEEVNKLGSDFAKMASGQDQIIANAERQQRAAFQVGPVGGQIGQAFSLKEAEQVVPKLTGLLSGMGGEFENTGKKSLHFGDIIRGLDKDLDKFGLSTRTIAVLLGAGFAGGLGGLIRIAVLAVKSLNDMVQAELQLETQTELTFAGGADDVRRFADAAADASGRTRQEIQELANSFAAFGRVIDIPGDKLEHFSEFLSQAAAQLAGRLPGITTLQDAEKVIQGAIKGEDAALKQLGLTFNDIDRLSQEAFGGRHLSQLTEIEKAHLGIKVAAEAEARVIEENGPKQQSIVDHLRRAWHDVAGAVADFFSESSDERFKRTQENVQELASSQTHFFDESTSQFISRQKLLDIVQRDAVRLNTTQLKSLRDLAAGFPDVTKVINDIISARQKDAQAIRDESKEILSQNDILQQNIDKFLDSVDARRQFQDASLALSRAEEDATIRIRDAHIRLERAIEDAAKKEKDTRKDNQRSIDDANRRLQEAIIREQRAREDRQRKLEDFTIQHDRKTEDLNREHQRKLEDFARREKDVQDERVRNNIEALVAIQNATFDFNTRQFNEAQRRLVQSGLTSKKSEVDLELDKRRELEDFERNTRREKEDRIRELGELEVQTNREIFDAHQAVIKALEDRQRAVDDAIQKLNDLEEENNRAVADAKRNLAQAELESARALTDANTALDRFVEDLGLSVDLIEQLLDLAERAKVLHDIFPDFDPNTFRPAPPPPQLAAGGRVSAGSPFIVGESGPELFVPDQSGTIIPNGRLGNVPVSITVNEVANDPEATAFAVWSRTLAGVNQ